MANAEGIVFFQTGGIALALFPRHDLAKDANVSPDGDGFRGITLAYNTRSHAEVDASCADTLDLAFRSQSRGNQSGTREKRWV
jgi:hypothetical protein